MADLVDRINEELTARLTELRPLVEEHNRLQAAVGALNDVPTKTAPKQRVTNASATGSPGRRARRNGPSASPRKRAPRGANREAVLRVLRERPGASSEELASVSGVERNTLNGLLARLVREGEVEKRELPGGKAGYALNGGRPDEPTSPSPPDTDPNQ